MDEAVKNTTEVDLDDSGSHTWGDVAHLLQILFICIVFPFFVQLHHSDFLLHQVGLDIIEDLQNVEGRDVPLKEHRKAH